MTLIKFLIFNCIVFLSILCFIGTFYNQGEFYILTRILSGFYFLVYGTIIINFARGKENV